MTNLSFSSETRSDVLRFYAEDWTNDVDECCMVLDELPTDVAARCIWDLVHYELKKVPLFMNLSLPSSSFPDDIPDDEGDVAKVGKLTQLHVLCTTVTLPVHGVHVLLLMCPVFCTSRPPVVNILVNMSACTLAVLHQ
jgi:hypothetical protein